MQNDKKRGSWVIILSLLIALILSVIPLPDSWQPFRPDWLFLVLGYWVVALPHRIGLFWAFIWGLIYDALMGSTLGLHSFTLCVLVFILQLNFQRIRIYPIWKQALTMGFLSLPYLGLVLWLSRITGSPESSFTYWLSAGINTLLWPWLFILLRDIRRYFRVI
ncbi:rod shape-determining protein MreD [Kangiella sediminilitoris]|uniref:Rod shape-determining protein MreD n=1 Tax=Kangiella sediminilitoris TaxID=1144748 RepID=A0A1B3BCH8_9GAMM|nr:rod shape-determining protein MreD [Kangiella sediminilitoris]AOE50516.1 Rod shape-determining protein MreD [Kangiella sediminilitoris]